MANPDGWRMKCKITECNWDGTSRYRSRAVLAMWKHMKNAHNVDPHADWHELVIECVSPIDDEPDF